MKKIFLIVISVCLFSNALASNLTNLSCDGGMENLKVFTLENKDFCEEKSEDEENNTDPDGCNIKINNTTACPTKNDCNCESLMGKTKNDKKQLRKAFALRAASALPKPKNTSSSNDESHYYLTRVSMNRFSMREKTEVVYYKHHEPVAVTTVAFEARGFVPMMGGFDRSKTPWSPSTPYQATVERDIVVWLTTDADGHPGGITNSLRRDIVLVSQRNDGKRFLHAVEAWLEKKRAVGQ